MAKTVLIACTYDGNDRESANIYYTQFFYVVGRDDQEDAIANLRFPKHPKLHDIEKIVHNAGVSLVKVEPYIIEVDYDFDE